MRCVLETFPDHTVYHLLVSHACFRCRKMPLNLEIWDPWDGYHSVFLCSTLPHPPAPHPEHRTTRNASKMRRLNIWLKQESQYRVCFRWDQGMLVIFVFRSIFSPPPSDLSWWKKWKRRPITHLSVYFFFKYLFIYYLFILAAPGLSCGSWVP